MAGNTLHNTPAQLEELASGNHSAFEALYEAHEQRIYLTAFRILQSSSAAQDALQEIFIKVWVNRDKIAGMDNAHFGAWFNLVIKNHLLDKLREQGARERKLHNLIESGIESYRHIVYEEAAYKELLDLVEQAAHQLTPQQQRVFEMSRLQGMKHREIADELGLSTETVKKYMMEALKQVRAYLQANGKNVSIVVLIQLLRL